MTTYIYDTATGKCIEKYAREVSIGLQIVRDIDPYRAVAVDVATGEAPTIGSRREHREFLKRNGYFEVGNEKLQHKKAEYTPVREDLRRAVQEVKNR